MNPEERLAEIEAMMASPDFWSDKDNAQKIVREYLLSNPQLLQDVMAELEKK